MAFAETALVLLRLLISGIIGLIVLFTNYGYVRVPKYTLVSQRVWLARLDNTYWCISVRDSVVGSKRDINTSMSDSSWQGWSFGNLVPTPLSEKSRRGLVTRPCIALSQGIQSVTQPHANVVCAVAWLA